MRGCGAAPRRARQRRRGALFAALLALGWLPLAVPAVATEAVAPVPGQQAVDEAAAGLVLQAAIEVDTGRLRGQAGLRTLDAEAVTLALGAQWEVESLEVAGLAQPGPGSVEQGLRVWRLPGREGGQHIVLRWSGPLAPLDSGQTHRQTLGPALAVVGEQGAFLPGAANWHPRLLGRALDYRLEAEVPAGWLAVAPGRAQPLPPRPGYWRGAYDFPHPAAAVDLMAGPYVLESRALARPHGAPIVLNTYFHPAIADLSAGYLDSVAGYLERYEAMLGPYPFASFSVVSSPTPTGFGMPGLTYLGVDVLRLPFIRHTSLGHEVLHCWLGNGIYPDYDAGNWSEGLTTFLADYAYKEEAGSEAARAMRLAWLRDFAAVPPGRDMPLRAFTARTEGTSQVIGYNKSAMVFYMLRERLGERLFRAGLRRFWQDWQFRVASWDALREAFEAVSGQSLAPFFDQWLNRPGAPAIELAGAAVQAADGGWTLDVELRQSTPAWAVDVPLRVLTEAGERWRTLPLAQPRQRFVLAFDSRPRQLSLDPALQSFRQLAPGEAPPILRQAMLDPATRVVLAGAEEAGEALAGRLLEHPVRLAGDAPAGQPGPLLLIGLEAQVAEWLALHAPSATPPEPGLDGDARVWTHARPGAAPLIIVSARDAPALRALMRPLPHYGRQSWLVFEQGRALQRGVWPARAARIDLD